MEYIRKTQLLHHLSPEKDQIIVMIHGLGTCWQMMLKGASVLAKDYHVVLVSVPGFDLESDEDFTSVEDIAKRIEDALLAEGCSRCECLYGLSMGGGIAVRMLADNRVYFRKACIDAGIAPYEYPRIITRMILLMDVFGTKLAKHSRKLLESVMKPEDYGQDTIDDMYRVLNHMSDRTYWRAYDSTDNYSMPDVFPEIDTRIEYWYGEKEKKDRKPDIEYVRKHIPGVVFREFPGMNHGQFGTQTEAFVKEFREMLQGQGKTDPCLRRSSVRTV